MTMAFVPHPAGSDSIGDVIGWSREPTDDRRIVFRGDDVTSRDGVGILPRQTGRRLSDKILVAFHHACDLNDFEVAQDLLRVLEVILTRKPMPQHVGRRRNMESLVAAHERLWQLRNPDANA